mmetsp:Transcript_25752/g.72139  ORF Transcript_25752/g.72139 Transcript_25752/m.72139 type:complete len:171 (+) Transcript_25752:137-649(+)
MPQRKRETKNESSEDEAPEEVSKATGKAQALSTIREERAMQRKSKSAKKDRMRRIHRSDHKKPEKEGDGKDGETLGDDVLNQLDHLEEVAGETDVTTRLLRSSQDERARRKRKRSFQTFEVEVLTDRQETHVAKHTSQFLADHFASHRVKRAKGIAARSRPAGRFRSSAL